MLKFSVKVSICINIIIKGVINYTHNTHMARQSNRINILSNAIAPQRASEY